MLNYYSSNIQSRWGYENFKKAITRTSRPKCKFIFKPKKYAKRVGGGENLAWSSKFKYEKWFLNG